MNNLTVHKKKIRNRKVKKIREKIKNFNVFRLSVHRTPRHIYAQIIGNNGHVLASASSLDESIKQQIKIFKNNNLSNVNTDTVTQNAEILAKSQQLTQEQLPQEQQYNNVQNNIDDKNAVNIMINTVKKYASKLVGELIAQRFKDNISKTNNLDQNSVKLTKIAFDRSGFKYHGRIKILADTARQNGLNF